MATITITFNEIRANVRVAEAAFKAAGASLGKNHVNEAATARRWARMNDAELAATLREEIAAHAGRGKCAALGMLVGETSLTVNIPESYAIGVAGAAVSFVERVAPMLGAIRQIGEGIKFLMKDYLATVGQIARDTFGSYESKDKAE